TRAAPRDIRPRGIARAPSCARTPDCFSGAMLLRLVPLLLLVFLCGRTALAAPRAEFPPEDAAIIAERWPDARIKPSGLRYVVLKEGSGDIPRTRQRLSVLYRGTLLDGTEFSARLDPADPFVFRLGAGEVIVGWEEAFAEMRSGEKRLLII